MRDGKPWMGDLQLLEPCLRDRHVNLIDVVWEAEAWSNRPRSRRPASEFTRAQTKRHLAPRFGRFGLEQANAR